jgi:hypothetical protein
LHAATHVGIRLQVKHKVTACHFLVESFAVKDVGAHYPHLGVPGMVADKLLLTSAEIVENGQVGTDSREPIDDMAPDKASTTGYESPMYYAGRIHNSSEPPRFNLEFGARSRWATLFI